MSKTRRRRSTSNGARIRREMKNKRNKDDQAKGEQDENGRIRRRLKT